MSSSQGAAVEFKSALDELVNNNKNQINFLTLLADDYKEFSVPIVDTIEKQIYTVSKEQKLPILYVTDSILKNLKGSPYRDAFSRIIVRMFVHIFLNSDEKVRLSLYKLRQTWQDIFPASLLYKLDMQVNSEDRAWPLTAPVRTDGSGGSQSQGSRVHVNPKFFQSQPQAESSRDPRSNSSRRKVVTEEPKVVKDVVGSILSLPNPRPVRDEPDEPTPPKQPSPLGTKRRADDPQHPTERKKKPSTVAQDLDLRRGPHGAERKPLPTLTMGTAKPGAHAFAVSSQPAVNVQQSGPPTGFPQTDMSLKPAPIGMPPMVHPPVAVPFAFNNTGAAALPLPPTLSAVPAAISNDTVRLEGIPANNRIFVDGRAHEVIYIDDTAVIERNGLPHRIYFAGPPRNVIIDNVPHPLSFGERKTIFIDGQPHILRFGAPSRELYMGDYPFKGQFGGPPIIATINGRRHEIRLSGPAPEVKIEPDPSHDLYRFMSQHRDKTAPEKTKQGDQKDIMKEFLSGVLQKVKAISQSAPEERKPNRQQRDNTSPIPCEDKFDHFERGTAPSQSLKDFSMRTLKIRYDAIVNALHEKQKNACPQCGMRMDLESPRYARHMDWHVKRNLQTLERTSNCRPWYSSGKDWLRNEEDLAINATGANDGFDDAAFELPVVESSDINSKVCYVCEEEFKEDYDEDKDTWLFKDCVLVDGNIYHSGCVQDASLADNVFVKQESISNECDNHVDSKDEEMKPDAIFNKC